MSYLDEPSDAEVLAAIVLAELSAEPDDEPVHEAPEGGTFATSEK